MKRLLLVIVMLVLFSGTGFTEPVKIGALFDLTGGTADVGKPYAQGVRDCVKWFNEEKNGIQERQIELLGVDYSYKIPQAIAAYKNFMRQGVVAVHGWGTGDTEALTKFVSRDKIPYFSASYS